MYGALQIEMALILDKWRVGTDAKNESFLVKDEGFALQFEGLRSE
jgi:hypothetical protein